MLSASAIVVWYKNIISEAGLSDNPFYWRIYKLC